MEREYKKVSHKELEILFNVINMPRGYIKRREENLINDYSSHLESKQAFEAFQVMIGVVELDSISDAGKACYESFLKRKNNV
jgi:hypothetical protein